MKKAIELSKDFGYDQASRGYSQVRTTYDVRENIVEKAYLDEKGALVLNSEGIAGWKSEFDLRGNEIRGTYFGVDAQRSARGSGRITVGRRNSMCGATGRPSVSSGTDGQPILSNGIAGAAWPEFDDLGNEVRRRSTSALTASRNVTTTAARALLFAWRTGVKSNKPHSAMISKLGTTLRSRYRYDKRGKIVEEAFLDQDGGPSLHADGIAGWRSAFDASGNEIRREFFGVDGQPTRHRDGNTGWTAHFERAGKMESLWSGYDAAKLNYAQSARSTTNTAGSSTKPIWSPPESLS